MVVTMTTETPLWKNYQNTILLEITHLFLYVMNEIFYSFRIVIIMSLLYRQSKDTVKNTNFRTFRGTKKGVKSVVFFHFATHKRP